MKENEHTSVFLSLLLGLTVLFGGMFICAFLLAEGKLPEQGTRITAYLWLGISCLAAAFTGAGGTEKRKLLFGVLPVFILLGCLFLLAACWRGQVISPESAAVISGICLLSGVLGAISGAMLRTKR